MFRFSFRGRRAASESTESRTGGAPDLTPRPSDRALLRAVHTCEASAEPLDGDTPTPGGRPGGCPGRVRRHAHTRTDTAEAAGTTTPGDRTKPTARAPRRPIQVAVAAGPAVTVDHRIIHHPPPVPCAAASLSRATLDRGLARRSAPSNGRRRRRHARSVDRSPRADGYGVGGLCERRTRPGGNGVDTGQDALLSADGSARTSRPEPADRPGSCGADGWTDLRSHLISSHPRRTPSAARTFVRSFADCTGPGVQRHLLGAPARASPQGSALISATATDVISRL